MEEEFVKIISDYNNIIYKICFSYSRENIETDDLYQEVVCNIWRGFPKFRGQAQISTWVYRITINTCITQTRKFSRHNKHLRLNPNISNLFATTIEISDEIKEMYSYINRLDDRDKTIILLYLDDKSHKEIAEIIGISSGNVAIRIMRIKKKLQNMSNQ